MKPRANFELECEKTAIISAFGYGLSPPLAPAQFFPVSAFFKVRCGGLIWSNFSYSNMKTQ